MISTARRSAALFAILLFLPLVAAAQPTWSASVGGATQYHWRGYTPAAAPVVQPGAEVQWGTVTAGVWGSWAVADRNRHGGADEVDVYVDFAPALSSRFAVNAGVIVYAFPNQGAFNTSDHVTTEVYAGVAPAWPLRPSLTAYYDFNLGDGTYVALGAGHDFAFLGRTFSLDGVAGYNVDQYGATAGFSHLDAGVSTTLSLGGIEVAPGLLFVRSLAPLGTPENHLSLHVQIGW